MLTTLILVIGTLLTGEFSWLASDTSHVRAQTPRTLITPEEPFTLTLALVGIATIAVYMAASRALLRRRYLRRIDGERPTQADGRHEQRRRGAA